MRIFVIYWLNKYLKCKKVKELGLSKYVARIKEMTCTTNVGPRTLSVIRTSVKGYWTSCTLTNTKYVIKCEGVDSVHTT
jgi:hypothetical protein